MVGIYFQTAIKSNKISHNKNPIYLTYLKIYSLGFLVKIKILFKLRGEKSDN